MNSQILENLFKDIVQQKVVLFLGAGSSVNDSKKFLSSQILEYYRDLRNIEYLPDNNDIVDFADRVFSLPEYDRKDFDLNIARWLKKNVLVQDFHKYMITLPWLSIISTNIDLIVDNAIEELNYEDKYEIINNYNEYVKCLNNGDKCKVIKLHGCISDLGRYPLLFSTDDFERNNKFYDKIFNLIKSWSDDIKILFVGYSFNDRFGSLFLNRFQKEIAKREFYLLNPHIDESEFNLKYLKANNIIPLKMNFKHFLKEYDIWAETNASKIKSTNIFREATGASIPHSLQSKISPFLIPLNDTYNSNNIDEKEFYLGTEPNFSVIRKNYDIIKSAKIKEVSEIINNLFYYKNSSIPFVFLTGSYGSGKSTFSYRLLKNLIDNNTDTLAFEIFDFEKISTSEIVNLINNLRNTKKVIIYSNESEQDLNFKKIRELRGVLSSNQFENISIIILQSIRENVLEAYKKRYNPDLSEINIDCAYTDKELESFLERLNKMNLLIYRSAKERNQILDDIKKEKLIYDQLSLSLYLLKRGNHYKFIIETYRGFKNKNTQKAFLFTCLLYQFGIKMPLSLLNSMIDTDWETFTNDVLRIDGKGIFIQEKIKPDFYLKSDLYFKIKHRIVAEIFIKTFVKKNDIFKNFQTLVSALPENEESIYVFINLIKNIQNNNIFDDEKINKLFDIAEKRLSYFPRFTIYYSRNLQNRGNIKDLEKALYMLDEAEEQNISIYNQRDKLIIHRKAVINFNLARKFFNNQDFTLSKEYFDEAMELFEIKHSIDPTSNFSYIEYTRMLLWYIIYWKNLDVVERTQIENRLKFIINKGISNMTEGVSKLITYKDFLEKRIDKIEMRERAEVLYEKIETRPLALLLKAELEFDNEEFYEIISEMENYLFDDEISLYLFNYYGENLQYLDIRIKFFDLIRKNPSIQKREDLNWLYYHFVAESYNLRFQTAFEHQRSIRSEYKNAYAKKPIFWKETDNEEVKVFQGKAFKNNKGFYEIKILKSGLKLTAKLNNKEFKNLNEQSVYNINLFFTYTGIWAKILEKVDEESN